MRHIRRRPIRLELLELLIAISLLGLLVLGSGAAFAQPLRLPATLAVLDDSTVHTSAGFHTTARSGPHIRTDNGARAAGTVARTGPRSAPIIGVPVESSSSSLQHC